MVPIHPKHILIVGAGSAGKRHLTNLHDLGVPQFSAVDPRADRREELSAQSTVLGAYESVTAALDAAHFDAAIIASPPRFHVEQAQQLLKKHIPVFMEKPLCIGLQEALTLQQTAKSSGTAFLMGYTYRWWPPLQQFRARLDEIGPIRHAKFVMSAHLADWHPWESYQDFFMASKELGGGALLDESHFLDLMYWFFGTPSALFGDATKLSNLDIDSDDNVDIIGFYDDGMRVSIHLDLYGRPHTKLISVTGENGTLEWSFDPNCIRFSNDMSPDWQETSFSYERNEMFVQASKSFLNMLGGTETAPCSLDDGIAVMRMIEAVRQSTAEGRKISLPKGDA
jgi:predicted dehydrogenase